MECEVVRGVGNHQQVRADALGADFTVHLGHDVFGAALEPTDLHLREGLGNARLAHVVNNIRIHRGVNHRFTGNTGLGKSDETHSGCGHNGA